ncbi:MAG: hypothetical protein LKE79_05075 [Lachnospiraceae bacterium]|jgi:hypothetical protein|nr:hypothetical protein [Lachnospiraceae bacterium]MCH4103302.1 hypothetical protein [Lachnospiraceae bacterium]
MPEESYIFFIIAGTEEWRIWAGTFETQKIQELFECDKSANGIYIKGNNNGKTCN